MFYGAFMKRSPVLLPEAEHSLIRLGSSVRRARLKRNWTQAELAERAGISRSTLNSLEAGGIGVAMGALASVLSVMDLTSGLGQIFKNDAVGEAMEEANGRKRARRRDNVVDF